MQITDELEPCHRCLDPDCGVANRCMVDSTEIAALCMCLNRTTLRAKKAEARAVEMMAQIGALVNRAEQAEFERDELLPGYADLREKWAVLDRERIVLRANLAEATRLLTVYRTASIRDGETLRELYTALGKATGWGPESQALAAKVDGAKEIDRMRQRLSQVQAELTRVGYHGAKLVCGNLDRMLNGGENV